MNSICVTSEIGPLKKVLVHRPGAELENLMPEYLERLLFDDIPYLKIAQEEHDAFCDIMRKRGVEVVYLTDMLAESLTDNEVKNEFLREFLNEAGIKEAKRLDAVMDYFNQMSTKNMVEKLIAGLRKSELRGSYRKSLGDYLESDYPFLIDPIPNLYFSRDAFAAIGHGVTINKMATITRNRETLFAKYIFRHNPLYKDVPIFYDRKEQAMIEGGDILILNEKTVAIGISQRTTPQAIEILSRKLLSEENGFEKILAIDIPKLRSFMHLDTVFTMVDRNKFTVHNNISHALRVFVITKGGTDGVQIMEEQDSLENILMEHLHLDKVELIKCGGGSVIDAAREQWNDGSNTLAVAPGVVVVYGRNHVTNEILRESGIETLVIPSSELSRGRGGPRCMSMPLVREKI